MPKAKVTEGPVGARVELIANLPLTIFGTVTAGDMGVTVETKVKRSSKHRRITYPYPEVVAFLEGAADEGAYVTVATTMDITEGTLLVEDADTITSEDGWMVIPQGNGAAVRVNEAVASDVKAIIHGDAFVKNGAAPTNGRRGPGRPKAATAAAADGTEPPKRRRGRPPKAETEARRAAEAAAAAAAGTADGAAAAPPKKRGRPSKADVAAREAAAAAEKAAAEKAEKKAKKKGKKGKKAKAESNWND